MKNLSLFLLLLLSTLSSKAANSASACLFIDQGQTCQEYAYNCDFSANEMTQNMDSSDRLWNVDQKLGWTDVLRPTNFPRYFVQQGTFGKITGNTPLLYTTGMWPCGAVALINAKCNYASLSHYDMTDPASLVSTMATDLRNQSGCEAQNTGVYILASNILFENFSRKPDNLYFRKIACSARQNFPNSKIHIYYSTKTQAESDSIFINKIREGYRLTLTYESGAPKQSLIYTAGAIQNLTTKASLPCNVKVGCP